MTSLKNKFSLDRFLFVQEIGADRFHFNILK